MLRSVFWVRAVWSAQFRHAGTSRRCTASPVRTGRNKHVPRCLFHPSSPAGTREEETSTGTRPHTQADPATHTSTYTGTRASAPVQDEQRGRLAQVGLPPRIFIANLRPCVSPARTPFLRTRTHQSCRGLPAYDGWTEMRTALSPLSRWHRRHQSPSPSCSVCSASRPA